LGRLDTDVLLPGHGDVWRGPIQEAAQAALATAHAAAQKGS
ncbi:MAG: MBL fold metallo-hydrolase, partial [Mycobacterium sp.]